MGNNHKRTGDYAEQPVEKTLAELDVDPNNGLSETEIAKRRQQYGFNEVEEKTEPLWHRIFRRFWGPIPWMIEIAAILSLIVQKWEDFAIISAMLLVNAGLDFLQEHRALNALKALKQRLTYDPPRDDSQQVIARMRDYGVQVKMVTGDNVAIAKEVGRLLDLEQRTIRSAQLSGAASNELLALADALTTVIYQRLKGDVKLQEAKRFAAQVMQEVNEIYDTSLLEREFIHTHESAIIEMIEKVDIFAEVVPEDKYRIVDTLQKGNHIVAMTGDGVNDAPALKKADFGFAVSNATDAARAADDIILTAPGLSVINDAVCQARITFARMKSYATFRIAESIRVIIFITLSIIVFDFYPITALMIILLALLNDIPILAIAYDNTKIHQAPVRWKMHELLTVSSVLGGAGVISSFVLFFILLELDVAEDLIRSMLFLKLIIAGHSTLYVTRSEGWFWERPYPAPLLFWFMVNDTAKMLTYRVLLKNNNREWTAWMRAPVGRVSCPVAVIRESAAMHARRKGWMEVV